jgi:hypothetical protein
MKNKIIQLIKIPKGYFWFKLDKIDKRNLLKITFKKKPLILK